MFFWRIFRKKKNKIIEGNLLQAFIKVGKHYEIEDLRIYADGKIAGNHLLQFLPFHKMKKRFPFPWMTKEYAKTMLSGSDENLNVVSLQDFKQMVKDKNVVTEYSGTVAYEHNYGAAWIEVESTVKNGEFIKEVEDTIKKLDGRPTSYEVCRLIFKEYLKVDEKERSHLKKRLLKAYLLVPEHVRQHVLLVGDGEINPLDELLIKNKDIDLSTIDTSLI